MTRIFSIKYDDIYLSIDEVDYTHVYLFYCDEDSSSFSFTIIDNGQLMNMSDLFFYSRFIRLDFERTQQERERENCSCRFFFLFSKVDCIFTLYWLFFFSIEPMRINLPSFLLNVMSQHRWIERRRKMLERQRERERERETYQTSPNELIL